MEHSDFKLEEIKRFYSLSKEQFRVFAIPHKPKKYSKWYLGFYSPYGSGRLANSNLEPMQFNTIESLINIVNQNFSVELLHISLVAK